MDQNADIPVPLGRGGRNAGLQGSSPEQSSTAALSSAERISERIVEQNVDIPVGGGLQDFRPGQSSSSSSHFPAGILRDADEPGEGVFRTFPQLKKKVRNWVRTRVRECTPVSAHPRRLLSSVFVSGSGSWSSLIRSLPIGTESRVETHWQMEDGYRPSWCLRPDGRCMRLGDGEIFETLDGT